MFPVESKQQGYAHYHAFLWKHEQALLPWLENVRCCLFSLHSPFYSTGPVEFYPRVNIFLLSILSPCRTIL